MGTMLTPIAPSDQTEGPSRPRIVLASRSPRRRKLLVEHGFEFEAIEAPIDDGELVPGSATPDEWVAALAHLKARAGVEAVRSELADSGEDRLPIGERVVLGADTVCVKNGAILGQPESAAHAFDMISSLTEGQHRVITGVCLICPDHDTAPAPRTLLVDEATVRVGVIPADEIERYVASGDWRGKAGGYNLAERIEAGWPIEYEGDPATVMGLPMLKLGGLIDSV